MRRWLYLLSAGVVALVAALVWSLRASPGAATPANAAAPSAAPAPATAARASSPPVTRASDRPQVAEDTDDDFRPPTELELDPHKMNIKLAQEIPQVILMAAAKTCYDGEEGRAEQLTVDFLLRVQGGVATIHDVVPGDSTMRRPRLEGCILDLMRTLTWDEPDMPDMDDKMSIDISILALKARAKNFGE